MLKVSYVVSLFSGDLKIEKRDLNVQTEYLAHRTYKDYYNDEANLYIRLIMKFQKLQTISPKFEE